MDPQKYIQSIQNPQIKRVFQLKEKSRERKKTGLFSIDGLREIQLAIQANYVIQTLFYVPEMVSNRILDTLYESTPRTNFIALSKDVYQKIAHRETTEGVIAVAQAKNHGLDTLSVAQTNPLFLIAEAPEKPGNIGALLRTADAAQVDGIFIANPKTDLYNPNTIRSSVGAVFTTPVVQDSTEAIIRFLQEKNVRMYCAALTASKNYLEVSYTGPTAIVVGTEATGLSDSWLQQANQNIIIPMQGALDSLNVSVSAAILIFEALRQRKG